ncbi:odorant receptor 4-like isoform X1 [Cotesia glomerata]|uniref:Odorant receptor n=1 Tax=Cotesia glomerata TaxID=32391 RepID=A0AAV7I3U2_COTGL|nr:odorant receptor 4-like isoform X1 [Cotesia glomerata]KAH0540483.1 hypothetical protein KQX54_017688 [Cotesia glomerata]
MARNQGEAILSNRSENCHKHRAVKYTYFFLNLLGIGPLTTESLKITKIVSFIWSATIVTIGVWEISFRFIYVYFDVTDVDDQMDLLAPVVFVTVTTLKYLSIAYRHDTIKKFTKHIFDDWNMIGSQEEEDIMEKNLNMSNNITFVFAVMMYISCVLYNCFMPHVIPILFNSDDRNASERIVIFPGYNSVFDVDSFPIYQITYVFHQLTALSTYTILITSCNLIIVLVTHACSQLQIITNQIDSLLNNFSKEEKFSYAKLSFTISRHVRVLEFSNKLLKKMIFELCLIEVGASSILLCIDEFCVLRMLEKKEFANMTSYIMIFFSLSLNVLIVCYFSELLEAQFMNVGEKLNSVEWYKTPVNTRQYFNLIIIMSQQPQKISAGGIVDLSFVTYLQILKTGFAYLQLLRAANL